jgi:DNA-binding winged helix-turn-helix (wHTH) protein/tetratricopeptide (TPR) repeat protein
MDTLFYRFGEFILNPVTRSLRRGDVLVPLSSRAFDCLVYLIEHRERAVGKDELVAAIWHRPNVSDTQLGQIVLRARRAVGDDGQARACIRTVARFGYHWIAETETLGGMSIATGVADEGTKPSPRILLGPLASALPAHSANAGEGKRRRAFGMILLGAGLFAVAALGWHEWRNRAGMQLSAPEGAAAVVLPADADAENVWLRLGAMDLVAERLRGGGLVVPPSENTLALLQSAAMADADASALAIRRSAPQAWLVNERITRKQAGWAVELRATAADGSVLDVGASDADVLAAIRAAADRLLGRLGRALPQMPAFGGNAEERLRHAQAALLANDLDAARALLIGDPALARAEPELGYRLAQIDFRAGQYVHAETALTSLLDEPAARVPLFRARLLNGRGAVRIRRDDYVGAERDFDEAAALLGTGGHPAEFGRALTGRGIARAARQDFAHALGDFGQARVQLAEVGDDLAIARVDADQGALEMQRDRPAQAIGYLESAAAQFERYGAINELLETLFSLFSNRMAMLQPKEALAVSDRSWALAARATDPDQHRRLTLDRIEVLLALGRLREAAALLGAQPVEAADASPFVARRLHALRARLALARGDTAQAVVEAQRALDLPGPVDDRGEGVAEIALVYQRALLANGSAPQSSPVERWVAPDLPLAYPAQAVLAAEWAVAQQRTDDADRLFRTALDMAEQRGEAADVALVAEACAPWLLQRGRMQEAGDLIGRVAPWANGDFDSALLQVRLFHALGQREPWSRALVQAQALAGEREIPDELLRMP